MEAKGWPKINILCDMFYLKIQLIIIIIYEKIDIAI